MSVWTTSAVCAALLADERRSRLKAYAARPSDVKEHWAIERHQVDGAYGNQQLRELVQNALDAIVVDAETASHHLEAVLSPSALYVANSGMPVDADGVRALLSSHLSQKGGEQIGRFGLGFKSVLALADVVDVFSHGASFRFDRERARVELKKKLPSEALDAVPALRVAWPLAADAEIRNDAVLGRLCSAATTVIRLTLRDARAYRDAHAQLASPFPFESLLLSDREVRCRIETVGAHGLRSTSQLAFVERGCDECVLRIEREGTESRSAWRVFRKEVSLPPSIVSALGESLYARASRRITWAVPCEGRRLERGRFCAYFPVDSLAPIPGLFDAAWQTNNDRQSLLPGGYNDALIDGFASLVCEALPSLATEGDLGFAIELLPREEPHGIGRRFREKVLAEAKSLKIVPRASGRLDLIDEASLPPTGTELHQAEWATLAARSHAAGVVHVDAAGSPERRARLKDLAGGHVPSLSHARWLEGITVKDLDSSLRFLRFLGRAYDPTGAKDAVPSRAGRIDPWGPSLPRVRELRVVWTTRGTARAVVEGVFLPGEAVSADAYLVHPSLLDDDDARRALRDVLGVGHADPESWRARFDDCVGAADTRGDAAFQDLWRLLGASPAEVATAWVRSNEAKLRVLTAAGAFVLPTEVLRAGRIISRLNRSAASTLVLSPRFEERHTSLLEHLRIGDVPANASTRSAREAELKHESYELYRSAALALAQTYRRAAKRTTARSDMVSLDDPGPTPVPFASLLANDATCAAATEWAIEHAETLCLERLVAWKHSSWSDAETEHLAELKFLSPTAAVLWLYGRTRWLSVQVEARLAHAGLGAALRLSPARARLYSFLIQEAARLLGDHAVAPRYEDLRLLEDTLGARRGAPFEVLSLLYERLASRASWSSKEVWTGPDCSVPITDLLLTRDPTTDLPGVLCIRAAAARRRFEALGATEVRSGRTIASAVDVPRPLGEVLWELEALHELEIACSLAHGLAVQIDGRTPAPRRVVLDDDVLRVDAEALERDRDGVLVEVVRVLEAAGNQVPANVGQLVRDARRARRRAEVVGAASLEEKVLALVGGDVEALKTALAPAERDALEGASPRDTARLFLAASGDDPLAALEASGAMATWRREDGSSEELAELANELGFEPSTTTRYDARRPAFQEIVRPAPLGKLHGFQASLLTSMRKALRAKTRKARSCLLSLPTGAGKTRVTVELLVREILSRAEGPPPQVLWIADRDELCEQAVASFSHVWQHLGATTQRLRVSRLWGGNVPRVVESSTAHVVVGSIQTLHGLSGRREFEWLRRSDVVVVDEAHHYPAPSYRQVLDRWLLKPEKHVLGPALIGLSATPFRAFSERGTEELQARFGTHLPSAPDELRRQLVEQGVLSRATFKSLRTLARVELQPGERASIDQFQTLPASFLDRLGADPQRNAELAESLQRLHHDTALVFCASVYQARWLAATLTIRGLPSAAIVGQTDRAVRRSLVDAVREGLLRFVTTHTLLATGFDAPKVDAVVIARPTLSRVLFLQMIGRGLRGPKNDGTPECTIYTVQDNLDQYGEQIEQVWKDAEAAWR